MIGYDEVEVGTVLPELRVRLRRSDLVRYAGASGDFNPIHWNARVAREMGLPDVIAHGMLTMAGGARLLTDWVGDPARVLEYSVRFTKPVVIPDTDEGVELTYGGTVGARLPESCVRIDLTATVVPSGAADLSGAAAPSTGTASPVQSAASVTPAATAASITPAVSGAPAPSATAGSSEPAARADKIFGAARAVVRLG